MFARSVRKRGTPLVYEARAFPSDEILYAVGTGGQHISGPFRWDNARLSIAPSDIKRSDVTGEPLTRLFDESAGFELLRQSGVWLVRGLKTDIVNSFGDQFLGDRR